MAVLVFYIFPLNYVRSKWKGGRCMVCVTRLGLLRSIVRGLPFIFRDFATLVMQSAKQQKLKIIRK